MPAGTYGRVAPRSGIGTQIIWLYMLFVNASPLASKFMIDTGAGVIDADYRGVLYILLFNLSDKDFQGKVTGT